MSLTPTQSGPSTWHWPSLQDAQQQIVRFVPCFNRPLSPYTLVAGAVTILAIGGMIGMIAYYCIWRGSENGRAPREESKKQQNPEPAGKEDDGAGVGLALFIDKDRECESLLEDLTEKETSKPSPTYPE